jgi:hypothetical protein
MKTIQLSTRGRITGTYQTLMTSKSKITFPCLPMVGFWARWSAGKTKPLIGSTQHVPPQLELLVVACLSTHVISSLREPVG